MGQQVQSRSGEIHIKPFKLTGIAPAIALGAGYYINKKWSAYTRYYHLAQMQDASSSPAVRLHRTLNLGLGLNP
ncbi:hypothetical protein [Niabella hibiscisoli]|uniref:hypothetical protein n=1 Tax=Niabella hibiscisoli TaxID=1825928 RepID=UPI001F0FACCC|nr:hypothetical protein [Niabella hibiscisoli]MCH5714785.1 hypothetical protein [Niabella hibiscisoli]